MAACEGTKSEISWCATLVTAATDCLAMQPASSFQCNTSGQPAPKSGVCASELAEMQSCWYEGPPSGLPDLTQACSEACAKEAALSCADPSCASSCLAAVAPGPKCNGALAALVACAATQDASSFACDTASPPTAYLKPADCGFQQLVLYACTH